MSASTSKRKRRRTIPGIQSTGGERKLTHLEIRELRARLFSRPKSVVRLRNKGRFRPLSSSLKAKPARGYRVPPVVREGVSTPASPLSPPPISAKKKGAGDLVAIAQRAIAELDGCLRKHGLLVFQDGSVPALATKLRSTSNCEPVHTEGVRCVLGTTRIVCVGRSRLSAFDKDANLLDCIQSISLYPAALASAKELQNTIMHELVHVVAHYVTKHSNCLTPDTSLYIADLDNCSEEGLCRLAGRLFADGRSLDSAAAVSELWLDRQQQSRASTAAEPPPRLSGFGQAVECARQYGLGFVQLFLAVTQKGSLKSVLTYGPGASLRAPNYSCLPSNQT